MDLSQIWKIILKTENTHYYNFL